MIKVVRSKLEKFLKNKKIFCMESSLLCALLTLLYSAEKLPSASAGRCSGGLGCIFGQNLFTPILFMQFFVQLLF